MSPLAGPEPGSLAGGVAELCACILDMYLGVIGVDTPFGCLSGDSIQIVQILALMPRNCIKDSSAILNATTVGMLLRFFVEV